MLAAVLVSLAGYAMAWGFLNVRADLVLIVGIAALIGGSLGALFPQLSGRAWSIVADGVEAFLSSMF